MSLSKILLGVFCGLFVSVANAADITIYYSPTCPHCHHAREFIENTLIYEYNDLKVTTVNVMDADNRQEFFDTLEKCEYKSGGVPVIVIGKKCFQGYSDESKSDLRTAVEIDLTDAQKKSAAENKKEMEKNKDAFINAHSERKESVSERDSKKKITEKNPINTENGNVFLYVLFGLVFLGFGIFLYKKQK